MIVVTSITWPENLDVRQIGHTVELGHGRRGNSTGVLEKVCRIWLNDTNVCAQVSIHRVQYIFRGQEDLSVQFACTLTDGNDDLVFVHCLNLFCKCGLFIDYSSGASLFQFA